MKISGRHLTKRTYSIIEIKASVRKWPSGGCYIAVTREWIGREVIVITDVAHKFKVAGGEHGLAYVSVPCDLLGREVFVKLAGPPIKLDPPSTRADTRPV